MKREQGVKAPSRISAALALPPSMDVEQMKGWLPIKQEIPQTPPIVAMGKIVVKKPLASTQVAQRKDKRKTVELHLHGMSPVCSETNKKRKQTNSTNSSLTKLPTVGLSSNGTSSHNVSSSNISSFPIDNLDVTAEEKLKEMERQLLSLDPDSKEAKKKRRLIRNRMSAQLHRERKKAYVVQLEEQLQDKDEEIAALLAKVQALELSNKDMKAQLAAQSAKIEVNTSTIKPVEVEAIATSTKTITEANQPASPLLDSDQSDMEDAGSNVDVQDSLIPLSDPLDAFPAVANPIGDNSNSSFLELMLDDMSLSDMNFVPYSSNGIDDDDEVFYDLDYLPEHWDSSLLEDDMVDIDNDHRGHSKSTKAVATVTVKSNTTSNANNNINATPSTSAVTTHDSFAAKKNVAMMMAVVFSVTFFGNCTQLLNSWKQESNDFSSYFSCFSPKFLSQMSVKSRVLTGLDGTSWMDFPELSSLSSSKASGSSGSSSSSSSSSNSNSNSNSNSSSNHDGSHQNGIPMDDLFQQDLDLNALNMHLIDDDEEEEEDEEEGHSNNSQETIKANADTSETEQNVNTNADSKSTAAFTSMQPSPLFNSLNTFVDVKKSQSSTNATKMMSADNPYYHVSKLWHEKKQVLCTLQTDGDVTRHAVVDMSHVKDAVASRNTNGDDMTTASFEDVLKTFATQTELGKELQLEDKLKHGNFSSSHDNLTSENKQVLRFLYPIGVISSTSNNTSKSESDRTSDNLLMETSSSEASVASPFMEVACHI